jgi:hypothetical protein
MPLATPDHQLIADRLGELAHELLDAHCDTVCLADELAAEPRWAAHVEYLKDLQRVGQRTLAELGGPMPAKPRRRNPLAALLSLRGRAPLSALVCQLWR